jgi:hypothetical protein
MQTVILVPILALVAAHKDKDMLQHVEQRHLVSCVVAVVQRHFPVGRIVQISSTGDEDDHAKSVLKAMHRLELWPVQVTEPSGVPELPPMLGEISSYIIFTRSVKDFTVQAEQLFYSSSCDSRGLFLIVVTVGVPNSEQLALSIVQELWQIGRGYNVLVMVQQDTLLNSYTWFPYSSHDNWGDVKNVVLINQWTMEEEGKFVREGSLFPYKIPSNCHGCTVHVSALVKGENEDELFSQYCLTRNITRNYINHFSNDTTMQEKIMICVMSLWNGESDVIFGGLPLLVAIISHAEPTFPYFAVKFSWFLPCPKPFSRLQRISHIFSLSVWVFIVVALFLVTVVSWSLAKQSNEIRSCANMSSAIYIIWAVTVGVSVIRTPRSLRLKLFFVIFVWYCSAISTVFQTFLTSILVDPGYENQLKTLEEILDSGIEYGYTYGGNYLLYSSSDLKHIHVVARGETFSTDWECLDRIRETGNFAAFVRTGLAHNYTNSINGRNTICPLNDYDYVFYFITTYVQKGSFFLESLNKFITISIESGMFDRVLGKSAYVTRPSRKRMVASDGYFVFTLSHLRIAFYILFLGHSLSCLLFVCEVLYKLRLRYF